MPACSNSVTPADRWSWIAHLDDGTAIPELMDDGRERGWADVPADRVVAIELTPRDTDRHPVMLEVPLGATAGLGRRRTITASPDGKASVMPSLTVLWWTRDGIGVWVYVRDDGLVAVSDREV